MMADTFPYTVYVVRDHKDQNELYVADSLDELVIEDGETVAVYKLTDEKTFKVTHTLIERRP